MSNQRINNPYSRRKFFKYIGLAGLGTFTACNRPDNNQFSQDQPIRIGAMYLLTGSFATYGEFARNGISLALEEINHQSRSIEVIFEDESDPIQTARRLVLQEKVDCLLGIDSSGNAEALISVMPELETILMITHAATPKATGKLCNNFVFRCSVNSPQNSTAGAIIAAEEGYKKWTTIGPDYAFGHQSWQLFQEALKARLEGVTLSEKTAFPKLSEQDYNSFITTLQASNAEAIWCSLWGNNLVNFIRQGQSFGLFEQFPIFMELGAAMEVLTALGDKMPLGHWVGTRYWWQTPDTKINRQFVKKYQEKYQKYPSYNAQNAYVGLHLLATAINKAQTTETQAIIQALKGLEYDAPMGKIVLRPEDHQAMVNVTWGKTAANSDYNFRILEDIKIIEGDTIIRPISKTNCQLT